MIELIVPGIRAALLEPCTREFYLPDERQARERARTHPEGFAAWLVGNLSNVVRVYLRHGNLFFGEGVSLEAASMAVRVAADLGLTGRILVKRGVRELPDDFRRGMNTMTTPPLSRAFGRLATYRPCPEQAALDYLVVYSAHLRPEDVSLDQVGKDYWVATPAIDNMVAHELHHIKFPSAPEHFIRLWTTNYFRGLEKTNG